MDAVALLVVVGHLWSCGLGLGVGVLAASDPDLRAPPLPSLDPDNHLLPVSDSQVQLTTEIVKQMLTKRCAHHYTLPCLKLDMARLVDRLSETSDSFQLLPGVSVRAHNTSRSDDFPADLAQALARDNSDRSLDDFLVSKLSHYLGSLTLSVQLAEPASYLTARAPTSEEGRRRKNGMGGLMTAGLFSGGTLMAVGMSALAALAGKALMTALLSLMLSALAAMRGGGDSGGGGGKTTYEIIAKPVVTHAHTHSSEVQHEVHGGHHHAYAYARSLDFAPVLPAGSNDTRDSYVLAYRAQRPPATQELTENKE